jgi:hypothetical protein
MNTINFEGRGREPNFPGNGKEQEVIETRFFSRRIFKRSPDDEEKSQQSVNSTDEKVFLFNLKKNDCVEVSAQLNT